MATWQLQKAKTHFSEVIEDAQTKGPQVITKHGSEKAVVLSAKEYKKITASTPEKSKMSLGEFLLTIPKFDSDEEDADFTASLRYPDETERYRALDTLFDELDLLDNHDGAQ
jgi:antitoxin Phd